MTLSIHAPDQSSSVDGHLVSFLQPQTFEAEQYRRLRQRMEDLAITRTLQVIAVTSPIAADGKTLAPRHVACAFPRAPNAKILLVDADLRQPSVGQVQRRQCLAVA